MVWLMRPALSERVLGALALGLDELVVALAAQERDVVERPRSRAGWASRAAEGARPSGK